MRQLPPELGIAELYIDRAAANRLADRSTACPRSWRELFLASTGCLKLYEQSPIRLASRKSDASAEKWMLEHMEDSEGLGAIFPPMVYILIVFRLLGYPDDHPIVREGPQGSARFLHRGRATTIRLQPCLSPVWDTGLALHALAEAGIDARLRRGPPGHAMAAGKGMPRRLPTGRRIAPAPESGGWFFEFNNPHYPDVDDTAMVDMALKRAGGEAAAGAVARGIRWLLAMQNDDGGWAAFDRTNDRPILEKIPFADHNAMQDPSCPDITGRVLECLGHMRPDTATTRPSSARSTIIRRSRTPRRLVGPLGRQLTSTAPGRCSAASALRVRT